MSFTPARASFPGSGGSPLRACPPRLRPGVLQHQEVVGGDVELRIVDARREVVERSRTPRRGLRARTAWGRRRTLEDGAVRRERPKSATRPPSLKTVRRTAARRRGRSRPERLSSFARATPATVMQSRCSSGSARASRRRRRRRVEVLHVVLPVGLRSTSTGVSSERRSALEVDFDAEAAGDRGEVDDGVGRAADREQHAQRVLDGDSA